MALAVTGVAPAQQTVGKDNTSPDCMFRPRQTCG